jgi:CubicO group peptidase (beta-lactamase class C family)
MSGSAMRRVISIAVLLFLGVCRPARAQHPPPVLGDREELQAFFDPLILEKLSKDPVPGMVVVVVKDGQILFAKGYGWARLEQKKLVIADRTIFNMGSVSKLITATAIMQLVEKGRIRLQDDVNTYLTAFHIPDNYTAPVTIANLLTHTGGFEEELAATAARTPEAVLPLGQYLAQKMPPRVFPPGDLISYSNQGYALLGYVVEVASGMPFEQYVRQNILIPLGMLRSGFSRPAPQLAPDLASGYEMLRGSYQRAPEMYLNISPAAGLSATATDMAHFMVAQLQGGIFGDARILTPDSVRDMQAEHFTNHAGLPGLTWGFFESFYFNLRCLYHTGNVRGYGSLLYLLPDQKAGVFVSNNGDRPDIGWTVVDGFLKHYFPFEPPPLGATPEFAARASRFTGSFQHVKHSRRTIEKLGTLRGGQTHVSVNEDGTLRIYGMRFAEISPNLFRRVDGFERVAFREDSDGRVTHLLLDQDAHEKLGWYETSLCQQLLLCFFFVSFLLAFIGWTDQEPSWKADPSAGEGGRPARLARILAQAVSTLNLVYLVGIAAVYMRTGTGESWFRLPSILPVLLCIPFVALLPALGLPVAAVWAWRKGLWSLRKRLQFSVIAAAALGFIPYLYHWNLLGFRY